MTIIMHALANNDAFQTQQGDFVIAMWKAFHVLLSNFRSLISSSTCALSCFAVSFFTFAVRPRYSHKMVIAITRDIIAASA